MWERIEKFYTHLYDFVMVVCKVLLLIDVGITTLAVNGPVHTFCAGLGME